MERPERRDEALILARGDSARMGRPKGLCMATDDPRPLIARIADLHLDVGHAVTVVTRPDLVAPYAEVLGQRPVHWATPPPGEGTARSALAGLHDAADRATHLWLHPVDVPRVAPDTMAALADASRAQPEAVIVPEHEGAPGHPVVAPTRPADAPWPLDAPGSMRDLLHSGRWTLHALPCDDPGVIDDLDTPADLGDPGARP